jgi:hypothetical protein
LLSGSVPQSVQDVVSQLSSSAGLVAETLPEIQVGNIGPEVKLVVLAGSPANLNELAAAGPQAQFVVISGADLPTAANLTVIRERPEYQAFLAGFITVLLSPDWRAAGLLPADGPLGAGLQDAFVNGGRYFCGVCASGWPLGVYYPQVAALPATTAGPDWQAAAAGLFDNMVVDAYYLAPETIHPEVISYLRDKQQNGRMVLLVGTQPPPADLRAQWAATIRFDSAAALRGIWPNLLDGQGGGEVVAPLVLEDVSAENLGEGRLRLVEELVEEIAAGAIHPFTIPRE